MNEPTTDDLLALFDELRSRRTAAKPVAEGEWPTPLVDWVEAYGRGDDPARWLAEPLLPDAGSVAVFAKGGTGKSLLALWIAAGLATGLGLVGPVEAVEVLYLDYEMTLDTVVERLVDMGYDEPEALKRLHYASLPSLAPLDTAEGGRAVVGMAKGLGARLVVIDTFGRAVDGEEDKADTVRAWYRWTGQSLKTAGIGFLRIDHAGKHLENGQRGSSAKNDDVDVVWEMTERGHGEFLLRATKRRVSWVDERIVLRQTDVNGVLGYRWDSGSVTYLTGTAEVADLLDRLDAPIEISRRRAMALLRAEGHGKGNNVVADALRWRRESAEYRVQYLSNAGVRTVGVRAHSTGTNPQVVPPPYQSVPLSGPKGPPPHTPVRGGEDQAVPGLFDELPEES
jgi:hypothetical protein